MKDSTIENKFGVLIVFHLFIIGIVGSLFVGVILWILREVMVHYELIRNVTELINYDRFLCLIIFIGLPLGCLSSIYFALRVWFQKNLRKKTYILGLLFSFFGVLFLFFLNYYLETISFYSMIPVGNNVLILLFPVFSSLGFCISIVMTKNEVFREKT